MQILLFLSIAAFLIFLNGFFVLAEFSSVKIRRTRIDVLALEGSRGAKRAQKILDRLDLYLSVCQVGITVASIGLGFVGEPAFTELLRPLVAWLGTGMAGDALVTGIAVALGFAIVSFLHIVLGELLPKSMAIRDPEKAIMRVTRPLLFFRFFFALPIWLLNVTVNGLLFILRIPQASDAEVHSDGEIRAILDQSQSGGVMSFRSLLVMENVMDFGQLTVRNAMRPLRQVHSLNLRSSIQVAREFMRRTKFSRYPVLDSQGHPQGFVHVKDLFFADPASTLDDLVRPCPWVREADNLERVMTALQRSGQHLALVQDAQDQWTGIITLEDQIEELIGTIEEEYPVEPVVRLTDFLSPERMVLDIEASSITQAVEQGLAALDPARLPQGRDAICRAVAERERLGTTYMGHQLAIPHARLDGARFPAVYVFRLAQALEVPGHPDEGIRIIFLLVTPSTAHRIHQVLLTHICGMYDSDFFEDRLNEAQSPLDLYETIAIAEQTALA